jgi:hypothetical protein
MIGIDGGFRLDTRILSCVVIICVLRLSFQSGFKIFVRREMIYFA